MHQTFTLQKFNSLPFSESLSIVEDYGICLQAYRLQGNYKISLFHLKRFYVEVWLNQVTDEIYKAVAFDEYEKLDPFLASIDLSTIYNGL